MAFIWFFLLIEDFKDSDNKIFRGIIQYFHLLLFLEDFLSCININTILGISQDDYKYLNQVHIKTVTFLDFYKF